MGSDEPKNIFCPVSGLLSKLNVQQKKIQNFLSNFLLKFGINVKKKLNDFCSNKNIYKFYFAIFCSNKNI